MLLTSHLNQVHEQLSAAAALGDERTREIARTLAAAAAPAVRLAVLGALSAAADEVTAALLDHPGSPAVTVRLGGEPGGDEIVVSVQDTVPPTTGGRPREDDGDTSARVSLRLSETLKADVERAAERDGVSVNTWLVRAAGAALEPNPLAALSAFGRGFGRPGGSGGHPGAGPSGGGRISGWIDG